VAGMTLINRFNRKFVVVGIFTGVMASIGPCQAAVVQMTIPKGFTSTNIGTSALEDPSGVTHTRQDVAGKVVVSIFSAPTMGQGDTQQKWSDLLSTTPGSKLPGTITLVLVEDMTQAGIFKGMALSDMKKEFTPHDRPFLILDQTGDVFKKFGMPKGKTGILIYDKTGTLRDVELDLSDQATTLSRIKAITTKLQAE
jgi:hypothetical protein